MDYTKFDSEQKNVTSPAISFSLKQMIAYTAKFFAPLLNIDLKDMELPRGVINKSPWYSLRHRTIAISPSCVRDPQLKNLAHETMHSLHDEINPEMHALYGKNNEATGLVELVAMYASNIFASSTHPQLNIPQRKILSALGGLSPTKKEKLQNSETDGQVGKKLHESHAWAERIADYIFERHGGAFLNDFAMADVTEAKRLCYQLGFMGPLSAPYSLEDRFSIVEDVDGKQEVVEVIACNEVIEDVSMPLEISLQ